MDADKAKTQAAGEGAKKRAQIVKDEVDEAVKYRKGQSVKVGGFSYSMSTGSTEAAMAAAKVESEYDAMFKVIEDRKKISQNRQLELHKQGVRDEAAESKRLESEYEAMFKVVEDRKKINQNRQLEMHKQGVRDEIADNKRLESEYEAMFKVVEDRKKINQNRQLEMHKQGVRDEIADNKRLESEYEAMFKVIEDRKKISQSRQLEAHLKGVRDEIALEESARRGTVLNNNFNTASPRAQVSTLSKVSGLLSQGEVGLAKGMYGTEAVASVVNLEAMQAKLGETMKKTSAAGYESANMAHANALAHRNSAEAMNEAHSAARGLAGGLNMLWVTWGSTVPLIAGAAISATLRGIYEEGRKVEMQLAFVKALGNGAGDKPVTALDLEEVVKGSSVKLEEAANGLRMLKQAGLSTAETMSALPTVLNLAVIGEMSLAEASNAATGAMKAFGLGVGQIERVADVMAMAASSTNASVKDMAESFKYAAPTAAQFGLSIEETAAHLALLSEQNIKGAMAGTTFVNLMNSIRSPTAHASKAFEQLGIDFRGMQNSGMDSLQMLDELRKKVSTLDAASRSDFISKITDVRGAREFNIMMDGGIGKASKIREELQAADGFARQAVGELQNTVEASSARMMQALSGAFTHAFTEASGPIQKFQDDMATAFRSDGFRDFVDQLGTGMTSLTRMLRDHGDTILHVAEAYAGLKVLTALTAMMEGMKASLSAARVEIIGNTTAQGMLTQARWLDASAAQKQVIAEEAHTVALRINQTATNSATAATTLFATEAVTAAGAMRVVGTALTVGVPIIGTIIAVLGTAYTAWQLLASGTDEARDAQDKYNNTAGNAIAALDKQIEQTSQLNRLRREGKSIDSESVNQDTILKEIDKASNRRHALEEARYQSGPMGGALGAKYTAKVGDGGAEVSMSASDLEKALSESKKNEGDLRSKFAIALKENVEKREWAIKDTISKAGTGIKESYDRALDNIGGDAAKAKLKKAFDTSTAMLATAAPDSVQAAEKAAHEARVAFDKGLTEQKFSTQPKSKVDGIRADNSAILEEYRHSEKMARENHDNEIKLADAYYADGIDKTVAYMGKRKVADDAYAASQVAAEAKARKAVSDLPVPADRDAVRKQLNNGITKIDNQNKEKVQQDALNESLRVKLDLEKELAAAQSYADSKLPAIAAAQARAQGHDLEAHALSTLTVEERNIQAARQSAREEYERGADDINQKLKLLDAEIERNKALLASESATEAQRAAAREALKADDIKKGALTGSLTLNGQASATSQDKAGSIAKQINEQNKWNVALQRSTDLAGKMESAFGKVGKSVSGLTTAFLKYGKSQDDIKVHQEALLSGTKDATEIEKINLDAKKESAQAQLGYYADVAGAAKGFFNEHSKGYEILQAVENTYHMAETAMAIDSFLTKSGLLTAFTSMFITAKATESVVGAASATQSIAEDGAKASASGIAAFAKTLASLPFPMNVAAGAGVLALLAGVGVAISGGGGSAPQVDISKERQKYNGTGVSYNSDASKNPYDWEISKSESISKSLSFLKDNSDIALRYSSGMLIALQGIKDGIAGMTNSVLQSSGLRGTRADEIKFGVGSSKSALGFSSSSTTLQDAGIAFGGGQTVGSAMRNGVRAQSYADIHSEESSWWGLDSSSSDNTQLGTINNDLTEQLSKTVSNLNRGVLSAADALGVGGKRLEDQLQNFGINFDRISLKGLKPDEIAAELEAAFSRLGDDMAKSVVGGLGNFQKAGEGYFETLVRVAGGVEQAQYALEQLNVAAVDYTQVANKQGDISAEIVRESLIRQESANKGVTEILETVNQSASELIGTYKDLLDVRKKLKASGVSGTSLSRDMIRGAGGLSNLKDGVSSFFDNFLTDEERLRANTASLSAEFTKLGVKMPASKAGFKSLIGGLDVTTAAGQQLYGQLVVLSSSMKDLADDAGNLDVGLITQKKAVDTLITNTKKWLDISKSAKSLLREIDVAINGSKDNAARMTELWAMMGSNINPEQQLELAGELKDLVLEKYSLEKENAQSLIDLGKTLQDHVKDLMLGDMSPLTNSQKLATATSEYQITLAQSRSGDKTALGQLQAKADSYLTLAHEFYASSSQYTDIFKSVTDGLTEVGATAQTNGETQLSVSTSQLTELQTLRSKVTELVTYSSTQYVDQMEKLAESLTTLNGMYERLGILTTVPDILLGLPAEIAASLVIQSGGAVVNGSHANGLNYVPFDGYVAELHKGERVLTAAESSAYAGSNVGEALLAEISALRKEVAELRNDQQRQTGDLIMANYDANDRAAEKVVDGQLEAADNLAWNEKSAPTVR